MSSKQRVTHVSILVPHECALLSSIASLLNIFNHANQHAATRTFDLHLIGAAHRVKLYGGGYSPKPDLTVADGPATDLILVPALAGNLADAVSKNASATSWLQEQYRAGAEIAGLCTGAILITDAGLIGAPHCSAHWFVESAFRDSFSRINLLAERSAREGQSISSEGGAYSFIAGLLERRAGKRTAAGCASAFETTFNRECQSVLTVFDARRPRRSQSVNRGSPPAPATFEIRGAGREGSPRVHRETNSVAFRRLLRNIGDGQV